ncbi:MAG: hypothetical protein U0798_01600 [Gemmataceae bacterium]
MNAVAWTAKADIPAGGIDTVTLDEKALDLPNPAIADWTPRPARGQSEPWERKRDPDWDDARFRSMDTGPTFNGTFRYPNGRQQPMVFKGTAAKVGDGGVLFDRSACSLAAAWSGGYLLHSDRRFGLLNTPTPVGAVSYSSPPRATTIPSGPSKFKGTYLNGDRVVFRYETNGSNVLETYRKEGATFVHFRHDEKGQPRPFRFRTMRRPSRTTSMTS